MLMKLLFVEDDQAIAMGLVYTLKKEGYEVVWCDHKRSALQQLDQQTFDLLLLDVGLPDGSGYDICTYAKSRQDVPVLFLTALDDEGNVVMGLDMGGDDYITKPFRINELLSRMRSVQRRYHRQEEDIVQIQYLSIYPKQGKVYREQEEVLLTALEYRLLMVFINHPQQVLSRSQLLEGIWDAAGDFVNDNTLTVYIKRLREKLERDPQNPSIIVTVRGLEATVWSFIMLRNTELRIAIWASLALMLVTACLLQPISTAAMLITFITQGMLLTIYLLLSRYHYAQLKKLSMYLQQVYQGDGAFDIPQYREGELSILHSDL